MIIGWFKKLAKFTEDLPININGQPIQKVKSIKSLVVIQGQI